MALSADHPLSGTAFDHVERKNAMKKQLVIGMSSLFVTAFAFEALAQRAPVRTRVKDRTTIEAPRAGEGAGAVGVRQRPAESGTVQTKIQPRSQNVSGSRRAGSGAVNANGQAASTAQKREEVGVRATQKPAAAAAAVQAQRRSGDQCPADLGGVNVSAARVGGFIAADTCKTLADAGADLQARAGRGINNGIREAKAKTGCDTYSCLKQKGQTEVFEDGIEAVLVRETGMTAAQADANVNALRESCLKPGA